MPASRRDSPFESDDRDPLKTVIYWVVGALVVVAAVFIGRMLYFQYTMSVVTKSVNDIAATTSQSLDRIQQNAAAASQAAIAKAERDRLDRAQAERDRTAAQQEAVDRANAVAAAKEAAWKAFYRPQGVCANPDNSSRMECVNAHLKAKTEFEKRWAAGRSLRVPQ